ncbi:DinB family protein [Virgibacillus doumboii]|uniref:DinB family protein n=1 Tax=Virgibacillus doumboii TaxID=2697503 RepID=UPI0013E0AC9B|nr:DinB family protein [Virgibacillus doumboii]
MTKEMILSLFDRRSQEMDAIKGLTAEQASWQPAKEGHSIWQIVNHLIFWNSRMLNQFQGKAQSETNVDNDATFEMPEDTSDAVWQKTIEQIYSLFREMQETVSQLDDSRFDELAGDERTSLKVVLGEDIAMHDSYHIGQILYIRKLQGITR